MCRVLEVSRSGYYRWDKRKKSAREAANEKLLKQIKEIFDLSKRTYGSPSITSALAEDGITVGKNRVARIMHKNALYAKTKKKFKVTTNSRHNRPIASNLLNQNFRVTLPNKIWISDITYIWTDEGWLYQAIVMDLYSRRIVGWAVKERITDDLVIEAFEMACLNRNPIAGLIFHSDRDSQYASHEFRKKLSARGFLQSMSGAGNCYDNACAESFFHTLKTELVYFEHYRTREEAKASLFEYVEMFYNRLRRHSTLGYKSPARFEELLGREHAA
jgi:putative transposase